MKNSLTIVVALLIIYCAISATRTSPFNDVLMAKKAAAMQFPYMHKVYSSGGSTYSEKEVVIHTLDGSYNATVESFGE